MGYSFPLLRHAAWAALCLAGALCLAPAAALAQPVPTAVELCLADAPPLTMMNAAGMRGILGEVTLQAAALAGYTLHPVLQPWLRCQRDAKAGDNLLIIPLSRTPDREADYTWVAPIVTLDRAFFSLNKRVESFEQARATFSRIAVGLGSAQQQKLRDEGFREDQIYAVKIGENPAQMLLLGRVDAWFNSIEETQYIWHEVSTRPLQRSPVLMTTDVYLACSKRCDANMVQRLKTAVETLRANGAVQRIAGHYLSAP